MSIFGTIVTAIKALFDRPMTREEVRAKLAELAEQRGGGLDTRSIVDVQKLLDMPSDKEARGALWRQAEQPGDYTGTAAQNIKLLDIIIDWVVDGEVKIPKA